MSLATNGENKKRMAFFSNYKIIVKKISEFEIYPHIHDRHYVKGDEQGDTDGYTTITLVVRRGEKDIPFVEIASQGDSLEYELNSLVDLAALHQNKPLALLSALKDKGYLVQVQNEALLLGNYEILRE